MTPDRPLIDPGRFREVPRYTAGQAAAEAGVELDTATRFRRALGLPEVDDDAIEYDERDVEMLRVLGQFRQMGVPVDDLIAVTRVYGQTFARIADAEARVFRERFVDALLERGEEIEDVEGRLVPIVERLLELIAPSLDYVHRRHLGIAVQRLTAERDSSETERLAVGFVDLVDFSTITDRLEEYELGELVGRFEEVVVAACAGGDVRLVKVIGDACLLVAADARQALLTVWEIVHKVAADGSLPRSRAGVDLGGVLPIGGDYFGRPVNVAARITGFARPGTTVVTQDLLNGAGPMDASRIGTKRLKGVGRVTLFKVNDPLPAPQS